MLLNNNHLSLIKLLIPIFLFCYSCSHTYIEKVFNYRIQCENCQQTTDGLLSFEFSDYVSMDSILYIKIQNISDKYIVMDERYFVLTDNKMVVLNPVGLFNPNINYAYSKTTSSSATAVDYLSNNYFRNPYSSIDFLSSNISQAFSTTESTIQQPFLMLPPKSFCRYYLKDYLINEYLIIKEKNTHRIQSQRTSRIKWDEILNSINSFSIKKLSLGIVYKEINEEHWKFYNINFNVFDIKIDDVERKK